MNKTILDIIWKKIIDFKRNRYFPEPKRVLVSIRAYYHIRDNLNHGSIYRRSEAEECFVFDLKLIKSEDLKDHEVIIIHEQD